MLCTEIVSDIQNNFCKQHVLPKFCKKEELLTKIYLYFFTIVKCLRLFSRCQKKLTVGVTDESMLKSKKLNDLIEPVEKRIAVVSQFLKGTLENKFP